MINCITQTPKIKGVCFSHWFWSRLFLSIESVRDYQGMKEKNIGQKVLGWTLLSHLTDSTYILNPGSHAYVRSMGFILRTGIWKYFNSLILALVCPNWWRKRLMKNEKWFQRSMLVKFLPAIEVWNTLLKLPFFALPLNTVKVIYWLWEMRK